MVFESRIAESAAFAIIVDFESLTRARSFFLLGLAAALRSVNVVTDLTPDSLFRSGVKLERRQSLSALITALCR